MGSLAHDAGSTPGGAEPLLDLPDLHDERSGERADEEPNLVGRTLEGRYQLEAVIGEGAMARIYRAHDRSGDRAVAVKVLRRAWARNEAQRRRFRNEAQATMTVVDPHVVEIVALGETEEGESYFVMEHVDGISLERFADEGPLDVDTICEIAVQLCEGLAAVHDRGLVHRDLKPENVIVEGESALHCKILDFGVAKVPTAELLTTPGTIFGTPCYMAPEQAIAQATPDARADLYALGVILYELAKGEVPFACHDPMQVMLAHVGKPPPPIREAREDFPAELEAIILRCLEKQPDRRFASASALRAAIDAFQEPEGAPPAEPSRAVAARRTSPGWLWSLSLILVGILLYLLTIY